MFLDSPYAHPVSSFETPVPILFVEPDDDPLETTCINSEWLAYLRGCAKQLLLESTWRDPITPGPIQPAALELAQLRAFKLIDMLQDQGNACVEVPDWEMLATQPGYLSSFFGQRGQGRAGPFYDYAGFTFDNSFYFRDINTLAAVGGLIQYFQTTDPSGQNSHTIRVIDCAGHEHVFFNSGFGMNITDLMGGPFECATWSIVPDDDIYVRIILKNNWTCGNV